jgi:hypothetical protein
MLRAIGALVVLLDDPREVAVRIWEMFGFDFANYEGALTIR